MPHCLGLLLPSPLWPNQLLHVVSLIFFLEINFYTVSVIPNLNSSILLLAGFSQLFYPVGFHWRLSESKSPRVSRTLLSIIADHNTAMVKMVSILPLISSSPSLFLVFWNRHLYVLKLFQISDKFQVFSIFSLSFIFASFSAVKGKMVLILTWCSIFLSLNQTELS